MGLIGLHSDGTLVTPSGRVLCRLPMWLATIAQRVQHWIAGIRWY